MTASRVLSSIKERRRRRRNDGSLICGVGRGLYTFLHLPGAVGLSIAVVELKKLRWSSTANQRLLRLPHRAGSGNKAADQAHRTALIGRYGTADPLRSTNQNVGLGGLDGPRFSQRGNCSRCWTLRSTKYGGYAAAETEISMILSLLMAIATVGSLTMEFITYGVLPPNFSNPVIHVVPRVDSGVQAAS